MNNHDLFQSFHFVQEKDKLNLLYTILNEGIYFKNHSQNQKL